MKLYLCIKDYWDDYNMFFRYVKGGLYLFEKEPIHYFDEHFVEYMMMIKEAT